MSCAMHKMVSEKVLLQVFMEGCLWTLATATPTWGMECSFEFVNKMILHSSYTTTIL